MLANLQYVVFGLCLFSLVRNAAFSLYLVLILLLITNFIFFISKVKRFFPLLLSNLMSSVMACLYLRLIDMFFVSVLQEDTQGLYMHFAIALSMCHTGVLYFYAQVMRFYK